jgi:hypothetical protein
MSGRLKPGSLRNLLKQDEIAVGDRASDRFEESDGPTLLV